MAPCYHADDSTIASTNARAVKSLHAFDQSQVKQQPVAQDPSWRYLIHACLCICVCVCVCVQCAQIRQCIVHFDRVDRDK
jgi:hypothetical protein